MEISLTNVGRRFNANWIFRNITYNFNSSNNYAILGENGSGKSTLLKIISGALSASEGNISYKASNQQTIGVDGIFRHVAMAAPYLDLIEEFTLKEQLAFHQKLCPFQSGIEISEVLKITQLESHADKEIKKFSSGMKQRVKLALAVLTERPMLLLDEPSANLDAKSIDWYQELLTKYAKNKLVIVCSNNREEEYFLCKEKLQLWDFKK